jgi:hypothetical protein
MRHRTLAQHEACFSRHVRLLAEIVPKTADCRWIYALGEQECVQIEFDRMECQKTPWKVVGLRQALAKRIGGVSVSGCQI